MLLNYIIMKVLTHAQIDVIIEEYLKYKCSLTTTDLNINFKMTKQGKYIHVPANASYC